MIDDIEDVCVCGHSEGNHDWGMPPGPGGPEGAVTLEGSPVGVHIRPIGQPLPRILGTCRVSGCDCNEFVSKYDEHDDLDK